jgi:Tfp pilus assembly protein PilW
MTPPAVSPAQRRMRTAGRRVQRGTALLEWMLASSLGWLVTAAALFVFLHQARVVVALHQRHWQLQDLGVVSQALRSELRMAGHRWRPGAQAAYDQLGLQGSLNPALSYWCDACGLMHRGQSAGSFQALHEVAPTAWRDWVVSRGQTEDCAHRVEITLRPLGTGLGPVVLNVRPRNLGALPCETLARPAAPPP